MRLVYYSLANFPYDSRVRQWIQSIRSLRIYNRSIPVWLFLFNDAPSELLREAEVQNVRVHFLGDYAELLQRAHPHGSVFALYPTFHKFLVLPKLPLQKLTQALYLDCDTFFFDDVDRLFDQHTEQHLYAREEPSSTRSPHGYNPKHINEQMLKDIAYSEGLRYIQPFNSGVCLLNRRVWHGLVGMRDAYLNLAWRLLCGWQEGSHNETGHEVKAQKAVRDAMTDFDRSRALSYPSANYWIVEQIALWLALGGLPDFSLGTLLPAHVPQGIEFKTALGSQNGCVLAHYFTGAEEDFFTQVSAIAG
jgi:hypothetical protein